MPNLTIHMGISEERTGNTFEELHKWIDESQVWLKHNHRMERHFYTSDYENFIKNKWGEKAVVEWLFHIAVDNLETANKFALETYSKTFDECRFFFDDKELIGCEFFKSYPNSRKVFSYLKKDN